MNSDHSKKIDQILQNAPSPRPPEDLLSDLLQEATRATEQQRNRAAVTQPSLLGRWIPRLGFALVFILAAVFITAQSNRYPSREASARALRELELKRGDLRDAIGKRSQQKERMEYLKQLQKQRTEIIQLKEERERLIALATEAADLAAENLRLQEELNQIGDQPSLLTHDPLGEARENARRIQCINNLKQIGLAYRIALNEEIRTETLIDLIPYLGGQDRQLQCPSDPKHDPHNRENVGPANHTYLWKINAPELANPATVVTQCPIHQSVGLYDGSVISGVAFLEEEGLEIVEDGINFRLERRPER